jgi:murein DD-endopeptidase MepM/ murein hydrolase activator NlpD
MYRHALLTLALACFAWGESTAAGDDTCRPDRDGPVVKRSDFPVDKDSEYVLPFEPGASHIVWRTTSHFTPGNAGVGLWAIDFGAPIGTPIVAARGGKVVAIQQGFKDGNDKDLEENFVMIQHTDGTVGRYIHLRQSGVLVGMGDSVKQGQRIALSGNSGQTGGPHLHFDVQRCGPNLPPRYNALPCGMTVPITFRNVGSNLCGLEAGRRYKAVSP